MAKCFATWLASAGDRETHVDEQERLEPLRQPCPPAHARQRQERVHDEAHLCELPWLSGVKQRPVRSGRTYTLYLGQFGPRIGDGLPRRSAVLGLRDESHAKLLKSPMTPQFVKRGDVPLDVRRDRPILE